MTGKSEWQGRVGGTWSQEWPRTDRSFAQVTEALLGRVRAAGASRVVDIGCGAGELSLAIARGQPECSVTGIDVSPDLVATARSRGTNHANLRFDLADAATWQAPAGERPDLYVSRHGVMFFDDPASAFGHLAEQAVEGAGLLFSCFRDRQDNPFFTEIVRLLPEPPATADPRAPGPFAFADPEYVAGLLAAGGWRGVSMEPLNVAMVVGAGADPLADAVSYFSRIGPAASAAAEMDVAARERFLGRIRDTAERRLSDGIVAFPASVWIVTAQRA
ncbi:class I SAM-dependent methyltransferase [Aurantiacibacter luteus]|uniref:Methyltransferase domain-containing protein n=1 Tax=Aurantiacibacter luteus TaxID=1581420 RepID=A0A0G9MYF7_9SPHN|nr:class I SAM-dependent methyltransferase [Aurantiacibacter luteus]KLE35812.1 hypothetical protein AAW00_05410 [Aurantiacibacter luteus]